MDMADGQFAGALRRLGGDEELLQELVNFFMEDAPRLLQAIRDGLGTERAERVHRAAHSLRGLAANFDAEQAMTAAGAIEKMASKGELQLIPPAVAHLEGQIQSLCDKMHAYTSRAAASSARH